MTMPLSEEQISREIVSLEKSITDFRNEMRAAMTGVVRQDVYQAQQETLRAQMRSELEAMRGEITPLKSELSSLRGKIETMEADKRQKSGILWGALASGALALVLSFINFNK